MIGPGKYDDETEEALVKTKGAAVCLLVVEGTLGSGFSTTIDTSRVMPGGAKKLMLMIADSLEAVARQTREDAEKIP